MNKISWAIICMVKLITFNVYCQTSPNLMAWWKLDGNLNDYSGNNFHGQPIGSPTFTSDRFNNASGAVNFNGTSQMVKIGDVLDSVFCKAPVSTFTITGWAKTNSINPVFGAGLILAKQAGASGPDQWSISHFNDGTVRGIVKTSSLWDYVEWKTPSSIPVNQWFFFTLVFDGSKSIPNNRVSFFVNNQPTVFSRSNGVYGTTCVNTNQEITFGAGHQAGNPTTPNNHYSGAVDDLRIFNRVLTTQEITELFTYPFKSVFYSKPTGMLNDLSTWGTNTDGSGTTPGSFNDSFNLFVVANNITPAISGNWNVTGSGSEIRFGTGTNTFNIIIPAPNTISAPTVRVRENVTITVLGELLASSGTNDTLSTVQYIGSGPQAIAPLTYYALTITGGDKSLSANTIVRENFNMAGHLNTGNNILILGTSLMQRGTLNYSSGMLIGRMSRWYGTANNTGNTGLFPLGTSTSAYRPISVEYTSPPTAGGILTCEFVGSSPGTAGLPQFDFSITPSIFISKAGVNGYWRVISSNGLTGGLYTVTVTPTGFSGINNYQQLRVLNRTTLGGAWSITGTAIAPTGSNLSPILSRTGQSGTNEFAVGGDETINPLPVNFVSLSGTRYGKDILISWATASESNVKGFAVLRGERTDFLETIGIVEAKGNSGTGQHYAYRDNNIVESGKPYYYQIAEVGENGFGDRSPFVVVNEANIMAEPVVELLGGNPVSTNIVSLNALHPIKYTLFDMGGKTLLTGKSLGSFNVILPTNGLYFLRAIEEKTGKTTTIKVAY